MIKHKVLAYITRGSRLLVFEHPLSPEAGIQVPGGTLHEDETPEAGAIREAMEETGLIHLRMGAFLGETHYQTAHQIIHHRRFYHLYCDQDTPAAWRHGEYDPADGSAPYIPFDFYWVELPDGVPPLIAQHDAMLSVLIQRLK